MDELEVMPAFVARDLGEYLSVTFDYVDVTSVMRDIVFIKWQLNALKIELNLDVKSNNEAIEELKMLRNLVKNPNTSANDEITKIFEVTLDKPSLKLAKLSDNKLKDVVIEAYAN